MDQISTPLVTYRNIKVKNIDLLEDAWGFNSEFADVINLLHRVRAVPGRCTTRTLIRNIRKKV